QERAREDRRDRRAPVAQGADLDRRPRHAPLPAADGRDLHLPLVAGLHPHLHAQRDLDQRGRPGDLARAPPGADRLLAAYAAGPPLAMQALCLPRRRRARSGAAARRAQRRERARRGDQAHGRGEEMIAFITANMAPIMFAALVIFLLLGYPVAFALAAN